MEPMIFPCTQNGFAAANTQMYLCVFPLWAERGSQLNIGRWLTKILCAAPEVSFIVNPVTKCCSHS